MNGKSPVRACSLPLRPTSPPRPTPTPRRLTTSICAHRLIGLASSDRLTSSSRDSHQRRARVWADTLDPTTTSDRRPSVHRLSSVHPISFVRRPTLAPPNFHPFSAVCWPALVHPVTRAPPPIGLGVCRLSSRPALTRHPDAGQRATPAVCGGNTRSRAHPQLSNPPNCSTRALWSRLFALRGRLIRGSGRCRRCGRKGSIIHDASHGAWASPARGEPRD